MRALLVELHRAVEVHRTSVPAVLTVDLCKRVGLDAAAEDFVELSRAGGQPHDVLLPKCKHVACARSPRCECAKHTHKFDCTERHK